MSKIHDGKLNMDENYPIDEAVKDTEPMIDEEVELALLEAMNIETPDLWDRIQAGINDSGTVSNVVPFEKKEGKTAERSDHESVEDTHDKSYGRRQTRRAWTKYIVAAALIMIVMIPVVRVLKDAGGKDAATKSETVEYSDNAAATYEATTADIEEEEDAAEQFYADGNGENTLSAGSISEGIEAATEAEAYDTEAATWEATEAAAEETVGNEEVIGAGSATKSRENGKYSVGDLQNIKMKEIEIEKFLIGYIYIDGEYYITDYQDMLSSQDTVFTTPIRITNPEESGLKAFMEGPNYDPQERVLISVKYPDKNNTNEVEIVDILEEE